MDWLLLGLISFVLLNVVDLLLTHAVIRHGGKEFNPVVRFIYSKAGVIGVTALKILVLSLFALQYLVGKLDMWTIWYFDFSYSVILILMYFDLKSVGAPIPLIGRR